MHALAADPSMFALFFGGWETVLILAVILILFGAKNLPGNTRGLGEGVRQFRKSCGEVSKELDQEAHDAGESLGGIYGKPAAQALTPDNQTAELYDPAGLSQSAMDWFCHEAQEVSRLEPTVAADLAFCCHAQDHDD